MPIPRIVTKANRRIINPVVRRFAGTIPPLALVLHRGRRSGKPRRTPVLVFPSGGSFVIMLVYGRNSDWVRNVLAADGCTLIYRRRDHVLTAPEVIERDPSEMPIPAIISPVLRLINVNEYMRLLKSDSDETQPNPDG